MLIYFEPATQRRVIPLLHYALKPWGVLMLGCSETIGPFTDLFTVANQRHKIYTKLATALPATGDFFPRPRGERGRPEGRPQTSPAWAAGDPSREAAQVLQRYAPAAVLVNTAMEILYFDGDTRRYLRPAPGKPSMNLLRMTHESLLSDLSAALEQEQQTGAEVRHAGARVDDEATALEVTIQLLPLALPPPTISHYLVVFEAPATLPFPTGRRGSRRRRAAAPGTDADRPSRVFQELEATQRYLQALMEQYEHTSEELKAANEEVISSNEELQSTNEELETAKEELQSMNEELLTTNDELRRRNRELGQINSDLVNLFSSAHLPIIMVDRDLRIRRFTTMAEQALQLIPADIGRPIGHLQLNSAMSDLEAVIRQVIDTANPYTRELQDRTGPWYDLWIRPYRTPAHEVNGAVLLCIDLDVLKHVDRLTSLLQDVQTARDSVKTGVTFPSQPSTWWGPQEPKPDSAQQCFRTAITGSRNRFRLWMMLQFHHGRWRRSSVRRGPWNAPTSSLRVCECTAVLVPIQGAKDQIVGLLVVGVSPRRPSMPSTAPSLISSRAMWAPPSLTRELMKWSAACGGARRA